jgi:hypothetical protein
MFETTFAAFTVNTISANICEIALNEMAYCG